jgi:hypothetical protein
MKTFWMIALIAMAAIAAQAQAGHRHHSCDSCGCCQQRMVCRMVQEVKKETTYRYEFQCDDYCTPGPSPVCDKKVVCDDFCKSNTSLCNHHCEIIWGKPSCCKVRTKKTLVKIPVVKEKCFWVCKLEKVCNACGNCHASIDATEAQTKALVAAAEAKGILPVSAEEPITMDLGLDQAEEVAVEDQKIEAKKESKSFFSAIFGK